MRRCDVERQRDTPLSHQDGTCSTSFDPTLHRKMSHQNPDLFKDSLALGKVCGLCFAEDPCNFGCPICQSSRSALWIVSDSHGLVILVAIQRMIGVYHFLSVSEDKQLLQLVLLHKEFRNQTTICFCFFRNLQIIHYSLPPAPQEAKIVTTVSAISSPLGSFETWKSDREVTASAGAAAGLEAYWRSSSCARAGSAHPQLSPVAQNCQATWPNVQHESHCS